MSARALRRATPKIDVGPTFREVAKAYCCHAYDLKPDELTSAKKHRHLVLARALFVTLVKTYRPEISYPAIGFWLNKNHSSVINARESGRRLLAGDENFRQHFARFPLWAKRYLPEFEGPAV